MSIGDVVRERRECVCDLCVVGVKDSDSDMGLVCVFVSRYSSCMSGVLRFRVGLNM